MHSSFIDSLVQSTVGFMSTAPIEKCNIAFTPPIARWTFRSESPQKATNFNQSISQPANQPINHPLTHSLTHAFIRALISFTSLISFHFIGISTTTCSFACVPLSFCLSFLFFLSSVFLLVLSFYCSFIQFLSFPSFSVGATVCSSV